MWHTTRLISGLTAGVAGVLSWSLQIYLAITTPSDSGLKANILHLTAILASIAIASVIVYALCEYIRGRKQDAVEIERDRTQKQIFELLQQGTALTRDSLATSVIRAPVEPTPLYLREAGMRLAKEYRDFASEHASEEGEQNVLGEFWQMFPYKELAAIKDRLEVPLGKWNVESSAATLPSTPDRIRRIANTLEAESLKVPPDVLL
jgi:hypothetical protein